MAVITIQASIVQFYTSKYFLSSVSGEIEVSVASTWSRVIKDCERALLIVIILVDNSHIVKDFHEINIFNEENTIISVDIWNLNLSSCSPSCRVVIIPITSVTSIISPRISHLEESVSYFACSVLDGVCSNQSISMPIWKMVSIVSTITTSSS